MLHPRSVVLYGILAAVLAQLWPRFSTLLLISRNAPGKLARVEAFKSHVVLKRTLQNCEDAVLVEGKGIAILSCDPGRDQWNTVMGINIPGPMKPGGLWAFDYTSANVSDVSSVSPIVLEDFPSGEQQFHPLGIEYHAPSNTLFVANHHSTGARIETFTLDLSSPSKPIAKHKRSIINSHIHAPNAIAAINENELYITNDHYFLIHNRRFLAQLETFLALPFGSVVHIDLTTDTVKKVARVSFANGAVVMNGGTTLAVSSTTKVAVYLYDIDPKTRALTLKNEVRVPFFPDNLNVALSKKNKNAETLLIAGHPHPQSLSAFARSRFLCRSEAGKEAENVAYCSKLVAPSWVASWSEKDGLKDIYVGTDFPSSCSAAKDDDRNVGIATGLYADGILVWRE